MSAGIMEFDRGFLFGKQAWHKDPRYVICDNPLTIDQVREVFNWEMEKRRLYFINNSGAYEETDHYSVVRKDTGHVIAESVGSKFEAESNLKLVDIISEGVLKVYPDLILEGAISLFNNKVAVIQLKAKEFQVKGDKSPSFTRMLYCNSVSLGSYKAMIHNERVVCANTLRIAECEGKANRSLKKFSHLKGAFNKINIYMEELAEQWLMIDKHIAILDELAKINVSSIDVNEFLKAILPQRSDMSDVALKHNLEKREAILNQFNKDQDLSSETAFSRYGLLQALTYVIDHEELRKGPIKTQWANWAEDRMDLKTDGYNFLLKMPKSA